MKKFPKQILAASALFLGMAGFSSSALAIVIDSAQTGNWSDAATWAGGVVPGINDTVNILDTHTVTNDLESGNLPVNTTLTVQDGGTLTAPTVIRANGANITVESGGSLTGAFWDLNNGTFTFKDGAIATMGHWEQKNVNVFNFDLSATGFNTLTPNNFWAPTGIDNATYNVDMDLYNGSDSITIVLADFTTDKANMDNTTFQGAGGLNVLNAGAYAGSYIQWNDGTEAIELVVVPEPSSYALISGCLALGAIMLRRRS